jgi:putative ABC transport system ATP-binding protein
LPVHQRLCKFTFIFDSIKTD